MAYHTKTYIPRGTAGQHIPPKHRLFGEGLTKANRPPVPAAPRPSIAPSCQCNPFQNTVILPAVRYKGVAFSELAFVGKRVKGHTRTSPPLSREPLLRMIYDLVRSTVQRTQRNRAAASCSNTAGSVPARNAATTAE